MAAKATATATASASWTKSDEKLITVLRFVSTTFFIGPVPVRVTPVLPISVGYTLTAEAGITATAWVEASAVARFGFLWTSTGGFREINDYTPKLDYGKSVTAEAKLTAFLWARPALGLEVNYLFAIGVGVKIGPELTITVYICRYLDVVLQVHCEH